MAQLFGLILLLLVVASALVVAGFNYAVADERSNLRAYCFLLSVATLVWALIAIWISTFQADDPLEVIAAPLLILSVLVAMRVTAPVTGKFPHSPPKSFDVSLIEPSSDSAA